MLGSRRLVIAAVAAVVAAGLAAFAVVTLSGGDTGAVEAGPTLRVVQPGAPGQSARTLSPEDVARLSAPPHNAADTEFMRRMIPHHGQALEMTALVAGRSQSPEISQLAARIKISQQDEIALMEQWLTSRREALPAPHANHVGHGELMPGMLDQTDLTRLAQAKGPAFDRLFLDYMIRHHQGAVTMVEQLYQAGGGIEPSSDRLAREVSADQQIEIRRMKETLAKLAA
ncbi:DUF305 domain-containing protein [Catellatospora citrea]|uniref:Lipoprotein n=1 Tax=Catellatospora citrea TaxID=53366 RepID=A0A8J3KJ75_9ACTN|nr:DUF305 domain-containing protein [Catellatospora citrea]RKE05235.1 uncharacterized protein (DUF305 family) [Catellatospora citrea]GIF98163.1 lipoprotein [Catellatospora citrea]